MKVDCKYIFNSRRFSVLDSFLILFFSSSQLVFLWKSSPVVARVTTISADFAAQFKRSIEGKQEKDARSPPVAQADFAYLVRLVRKLRWIEDCDPVCLCTSLCMRYQGMRLCAMLSL